MTGVTAGTSLACRATQWHDGLIPPDQALAQAWRGLPETAPSQQMVDRDYRMHRVIADERLIREARRCRELWHSLQELGGIHNSHAEALLAHERNAWEPRVQRDSPSPEVVRAPEGMNGVPASAAPGDRLRS